MIQKFLFVLIHYGTLELYEKSISSAAFCPAESGLCDDTKSPHDKYPRPACLACHYSIAAKRPVWRRAGCLDLCVGLEMIHVSYYLQTIQLTS